MADFNTIRKTFVDTLLMIPGMASDPTLRDSLLQGLPQAPLVRATGNGRLDLNNIIDGLRMLGRLNDQGGTRPLIVVAENALEYVPDGGDVATKLKEVIGELTVYYGGDVQSSPPPLPVGQSEALIFGRQRDNRVRWTFVEGAVLTARSLARLQVPRFFNGQRAGLEGVFGTGWLITPDLLITNHHVIDARHHVHETPASPDDFRVQAEGVTAWFDYHLENGQYLVCEGAELVHADAQLDYVLLRMKEANKVAGRRPLNLVRHQPDLVRGNRLNIAQHPGGGALQLAIRNNFYVGPGLKSDFVRYQTDTEPGSSGSPVCNDDWHVVALHHSSTPAPADQVPQEVINGEVVTVTILNEATAIHSVLNNLPHPVRTEIWAAQGW